MAQLFQGRSRIFSWADRAAAIEAKMMVVAVVAERAVVQCRAEIGTVHPGARVRVSYNVHLPALVLWDRENLRTLLEGAALPTLHIHIIFKNWYLCGLSWDDCEHKTCTPLPPRKWRPTLTG